MLLENSHFAANSGQNHMAQTEIEHAKIVQRFATDCFQNGDKNVIAGIRLMLSQTTANITITSKPTSLTGLMKIHVDGPIQQWLTRIEYPEVVEYSSMILGEIRDKKKDAAGFLYHLERNGHPKAAFDGDWPDWIVDEFSQTIDCLHALLDFCYYYQPTTEKAVRGDPKKHQTATEEATERFGWGRKPGSRSISTRDRLPFYLDSKRKLLEQHCLCLACGKPVASQAKRNQVANKVADQRIRRALEENMPFSLRLGGSLNYCKDHIKSSAGDAGERQARRWRKSFFSLLQAMERKEVGPKIFPFLAPSFMFEFATLAIRNGAARKKLKLIESKLPAFYLRLYDEGQEREAIGSEIVDCIHWIFFKILRLDPKPYAPPRITIGQVNGQPFVTNAPIAMIVWPSSTRKRA